MYITEEINQLPRNELLDLIWLYDKYVIEVCDRQDGSVPVCLKEFYENDYSLFKQKYELVMAEDCFDDDNDGLIYGIHWLDEDGNICDCEWFKTEEERQECINKIMRTKNG